MVNLIEKIKDTPGRFHSWWKSDVGIIRKPNSSAVKTEPKVEDIKINNTMEENKKVLFFLPAEKLWARVIRRAVVVAVFTFVAIVLKDWIIPVAPEVWVAVIGGLLVAIEKMIRDLIAVPVEK